LELSFVFALSVFCDVVKRGLCQCIQAVLQGTELVAYWSEQDEHILEG